MQTLIFNTTTKTAEVIYGNGSSKMYNDVPTVSIQEGYYEIRQLDVLEDKRYPVLRLPIANTNMEITR